MRHKTEAVRRTQPPGEGTEATATLPLAGLPEPEGNTGEYYQASTIVAISEGGYTLSRDKEHKLSAT